MQYKFSNNYLTTLSANLASTDTVVSLQDITGFPAANFEEEYVLLTLEDLSKTKLEIVKVTDRTGSECTIERGQEGTTAQDFATGDEASNRLTAEVINTKVDTARTLTAGDGLSGGGTLAANRAFAVDETVIRTTGDQTIGGLKTFSDSANINGDLNVVGEVEASSFSGDGSDLTGTASLRATGTTKEDVGLDSVDNVSAADLRDRSSHTGTQPHTTVTGLGTAATSDIGTSAGEVLGTEEAKDYFDLGYEPSVQPSLSSSFERNEHKLVEDYGLVEKQITDLWETTNGTATRVDHRGLTVPTVANKPRVDWSSGKPRLLVEEQRTNLLRWSEDFSQTVWNKNNVIVSSNVITSPDGNLTADKFTENTSLGEHRLEQTISTPYAGEASITVFAKAAEYDSFMLRGVDVGANEGTFVTSTMTLVGEGTAGGGEGSIEALPNGWYKCSISFTKTGDVTSKRIRIHLLKDGSINYEGDGTSGLYIWGSQMEQALTPSSYIPTEDSEVTRVADNVIRTLGSEVSKSEWSVFVDFDYTYMSIRSNPHIFSLSSSVTSYALPRSSIRVSSSTGSWGWQVLSDDGSVLLSTNAGLSPFNNGKNKLCYSYKNGSAVLSLNGQAISLTPDFTDKSFNNLVTFWVTASNSILNYVISDLKIFPKYLSQSECEELTK